MTPAAGQQRRGRKIAMTTAELDDFLAGQRTCRVATVGARGPHLTPLWYVWDGTALWLTSVVASQRWADLRRDLRVAVLVDAGEDYGEPRGAQLRGSVEVVGEVPRTRHTTRAARRTRATVRPQVRRRRLHGPRRPARVASPGPGHDY